MWQWPLVSSFPQFAMASLPGFLSATCSEVFSWQIFDILFHGDFIFNATCFSFMGIFWWTMGTFSKVLTFVLYSTMVPVFRGSRFLCGINVPK